MQKKAIYNLLIINGFMSLAEREGFEPSVESNPHTRLAGEHHRPLGHLSNLAEEVGFEPTVLSYNGFQDRRLKPLGHSSTRHLLPLAQQSVNILKGEKRRIHSQTLQKC